jgi:hypothetical protein
MAKGGVVLGVLALLIGASGLGFGLITWINQNAEQGVVQGETWHTIVVTNTTIEFWYIYKEEIFTPTDLVYTPVPGLYALIDLNVSTPVYMLFTTSTKILPNPVSYSDMLFYFWIDGVRLDHPFTRAGPYQGDATYQYYPVTLQHFQLLSAGIHNISVGVFSEIAGNFMRDSALAITRF